MFGKIGHSQAGDFFDLTIGIVGGEVSLVIDGYSGGSPRGITILIDALHRGDSPVLGGASEIDGGICRINAVGVGDSKSA